MNSKKRGAGSALCSFTDNIVYGGNTTVQYVTESGTIAEDPVYNAGSLQFVPLQASSPLYDIMSSWIDAGYK